MRVDAPRRMQLSKCRFLPRQLRSEPEEVNVASGVVAMRRSVVADRLRRGGRQNAYATLCADFLEKLFPLAVAQTPIRRYRIAFGYGLAELRFYVLSWETEICNHHGPCNLD